MVELFGVLAALALVAQSAGGVFEIELWPGEGRPEFRAVANELAVRDHPATSARIVRRIGVKSGQRVRFDETRYRTIESGRLQVLAAGTITGRLLGQMRQLTRDAYYRGRFPREVVALKKGDVLEYLQDRAEGTCFVRAADQVIDADPCPAEDDRAVRVVTRPKTEWWIRIVVDSVPVGWVLVDDKSLKLTDRSF